MINGCQMPVRETLIYGEERNGRKRQEHVSGERSATGPDGDNVQMGLDGVFLMGEKAISIKY